MSLRRIATVTLLLLAPMTALAASRGEYIPGSRWLNARGTGMGDALAPFANDAGTALFYNPAGLGALPKKIIEPLNFDLSGNMGFFSGAGLGTINFFSLGAITPYVSPNQSISVSVLPNVGFRFNWFSVAAGLLYQSKLSVGAVPGGYRYRSHHELTPAVGMGLRLASGIIKLGYSMQWVNKNSGDITTATPTSWREGLSQGSGFSSNIGLTITMPWKTLPSLHAVVYNFIQTPYIPFSIFPYAVNSPGVPTTEPMSMDFGFSMQPKLGKGWIWNLSFLYRDALNVSQSNILRHVIFGNEFNFRDKLFIRSGIQIHPAATLYLWPSLGIGYRTKHSDMGVSYYSEDIGTPAIAERDQRIMMQYSLRFQ